MWSGLGTLLLLSLSLAVSSLLAGSLPLVFSLSRRHIRLLAACGTGILMGTALIVIIPEGVEALYSVSSAATVSTHRLQIRSTAATQDAWLVDRAVSWETDGLGLDRRVTQLADDGSFTGLADDIDQLNGDTDVDDELDELQDTDVPAMVPSHEDHAFEPHAWVGVCLISGFVLMYLIDKLPKLALSPTKLRPAYISLGQMGLRRGADTDGDVEDHDMSPESSHDSGFAPSSTTTGLVIHAAADGIALGASSASSSSNLSMIIFLALMIHKAPAAFGLTTVLLKQGLAKRTAKTHLLVFSLAAPVGALVTWIVANIIGGSAVESGSTTTFITALLLLFSGGTFLYVAMHTMQDPGHDHAAQEHTNGNGYSDIYLQPTKKEEDTPTMLDTLATVAGMLLPLLTQVNHSH